MPAIQCQKSLFSLGDIHYLNAAYMSPLSKKTEAAGLEGMQRRRTPTHIKPHHFFEHRTRIRIQCQQLIRAASPDHIAILPSVSYGMAIVAHNTPVQRGQNIVVAAHQMPSNFYVWQRLCAEQGLELRITPQPEEINRRADYWNEALLDNIDKNTAIVSLGHIHWLDGTLFALHEISNKVHACGGVLIVDATQSLGALPLDIQLIQPDAVIAASYKCLMGPYAMAVGYFGPRYLNGVPLEENWINRVRSDDFPNLTRYQRSYRSGALRYDVGESSNFILSPMLASALEQINTWGVAAVADYCTGLSRKIAGNATEMGFRVSDETQRAPHYIGLPIPPGTNTPAMAQAFAAHNVAVSIRGDFLRVTPLIYNDDADIAALLDVLAGFRPVSTFSAAAHGTPGTP